eukprot:gnl/TRDRNA2_/TRDRNA2_86266_c0_seq1.p1 gnl/TRDRNA2_/TRDRNA2_86266_c0~~gnl/TRDRNA2_/TRDRNA2_86266_c0_seq1.p1  ORF type:complete len:305 (-),score=73.11 gnl/TRDRNA2_/TRDRNA2_86266_c0_seq1:70-984(-)
MGVIGTLAQVGFGCALLLSVLPPWLAGQMLLLVWRQRGGQQDAFRKWISNFVIKMTCITWRMALAVCFWVQVRVDGLEDFRAAMKAKSGKPRIVIANHTSFLDTILCVILMPLAEVGQTRIFASATLLKMPVVGGLIKAMGHMTVPFKASAESKDFTIDKEAMAVEMQKLEDHVREGGVAAWYPEGTMNRTDSTQVQTFRAGGFTMATKVDCEIWCIAYVGNSVCWPPKAPIGGFASHIGIKIFRLCESSKTFLGDTGDEREQCLKIANTAHDEFQKKMDALVAEGWVSYKKPKQLKDETKKEQ